MENRKDNTVCDRVEKLVRVPGSSEWPRLRLAITDYGGDDQVWIVKRSAECVRQCISEFAAFMDRPGRLRRHVAWNPAWKGELLEQALHPFFIRRNVWINLAVSPLEVCIGHKTRPAVTRTSDVDHIEVMPVDETVQVEV